MGQTRRKNKTSRNLEKPKKMLTILLEGRNQVLELLGLIEKVNNVCKLCTCILMITGIFLIADKDF